MSQNTREAEHALAGIAEPIFRRPEVVKQDGEYDDNPAALFGFTAHGFDTDLTPFYSATQLQEAMRAAWTASRKAALEEAAKVCDAQGNAYPDHPFNDGVDACAAAIRAEIDK